MKSILLSIKPKWVAKILNGEKTIEVRKRFPKNYKGWVYIYCTKGKPYMIRGYFFKEGIIDRHKRKYYVNNEKIFPQKTLLNGKVVARFYCDNVEEFELKLIECGLYFTKSGVIDFPNEDAQLDNFELLDYAGKKLGTKLYAIHISQLEIFDIPKELKHFRKHCGKMFNEYSNCINCKAYKVDWDLGDWCKRSELTLTKAPQSWCYVEARQ